MPTVLNRYRAPVVLLAVIAMVFAMVALPAPAFGATAACPDTVPDAGFTDIGTLSQEAQDAINCIAFYGVTTGTSATTYSPDLDVNRWQMALFLTRAYALVDDLPTPADQGFTDIGSLPQATQDAINQLAQLGVTQGTSATTYSPDDPVTRWQMALFITRLLTAAGISLPTPADQGFTDIGGLDQATQDAINQLAQLGISKGTSATTYSPTLNVNRWQMALFLARTLDVMGVVPSGVTMTADMTSAETIETITLTIMVAQDNMPVEGARVDVTAAKEFNADGSVKTFATDQVFDWSGTYFTGSTEQTIDVGDPVTDVNGMVTIKVTTTALDPTTATIVAFTGAVGAELKDAAAADRAEVTISWTPGPADVLLTTTDDATGVNLGGAAFATAPFGTAQAYTVQLLDADGDEVASSETIQVRYETYINGGLDSTSTMTKSTDASGMFTESLTQQDPDPAASSDDQVWVEVAVRVDTDRDGSFADEMDTWAILVWDDDPVGAPIATLSGPDAADMDGFATVTVTVVDSYYMDPISGAKVQFDWTNNPGTPVERTLSTSGTASITISGPGSNAVVDNDVVSVRVDNDLSTSAFDDPGADDDTHTIAWYDDLLTDVPGPATWTIIDFDTASDTIVVTDGFDNYRIFYDADDQFEDTSGPATMAEFEADLKNATFVTVDPYDVNNPADATADVSKFILS